MCLCDPRYCLCYMGVQVNYIRCYELYDLCYNIINNMKMKVGIKRKSLEACLCYILNIYVRL